MPATKSHGASALPRLHRHLERDERGDEADGDEHARGARGSTTSGSRCARDASAIAIDAEYTITSPIASSSSAAQASDAS